MSMIILLKTLKDPGSSGCVYDVIGVSQKLIHVRIFVIKV